MKLAALDVGTNTVLMLVVECSGNGNPQTIADFSRITRLGRGVDATGKLDDTAAALTLATIREFHEKAQALGVDKVIAAATAALRDATDSADFINQVKADTGSELEVVSGETEAQLCYLSTIKSLSLDAAGGVLVVDIGGGSTELIRAAPGRKLDCVSLQVGSVRLTERIVKHDPPLAREAADLRLAVDEAVRAMNWNFHPDTMVGIASTVTTICAVALSLDKFAPALLHGHRLSHREVLAVIAKLGAVALDERRKIPGVERDRADVIFAGAAILERIMANFGIQEVIVSDQGLRWGLVWREFEKSA